MADSNVTLITAMGASNDKKERRALPWLVGEPDPNAEVIEEIVNRFHVYAMLGQRKLHSKNEEEKRIADTFLKCERVVMEYFYDKAREINTAEARDIAAKAMDIVDEFYGWFEPRGKFTKEDWEPYMKLFIRWKKVLRKFYMMIDAKAGKPPSTRDGIQEDIPGKYRTSPMLQKELTKQVKQVNQLLQEILKEQKSWLLKKTSRLVGAIIVAIIGGLIVAILIDIFGDFGWLEGIKTFIYKILHVT